MLHTTKAASLLPSPAPLPLQSHLLDHEGRPGSRAHPALDGHGGHVLEHHILHFTAERSSRGTRSPGQGQGRRRGQGKGGGPRREARAGVGEGGRRAGLASAMEGGRVGWRAPPRGEAERRPRSRRGWAVGMAWLLWAGRERVGVWAGAGTHLWLPQQAHEGLGDHAHLCLRSQVEVSYATAMTWRRCGSAGAAVLRSSRVVGVHDVGLPGGQRRGSYSSDPGPLASSSLRAIEGFLRVLLQQRFLGVGWEGVGTGGWNGGHHSSWKPSYPLC